MTILVEKPVESIDCKFHTATCTRFVIIQPIAVAVLQRQRINRHDAGNNKGLFVLSVTHNGNENM